MVPALWCDEDEDEDDGVPGEQRAPGNTEKVVGILSPNLASNSLHTAKLRLMLSEPGRTPKPKPTAASEPLASSWQRSTKLPLRTDPSWFDRPSRGLAVRTGLELWKRDCTVWVCGAGAGPAETPTSRNGLLGGTGGGACRGRLPYNEADEPDIPVTPRPPEWRRSTLNESLS